MGIFINQWKRLLASICVIVFVGLSFVFLAGKSDNNKAISQAEEPSVVDVLNAEPETELSKTNQVTAPARQAASVSSEIKNNVVDLDQWLKKIDKDVKWRVNRNDKGRVLAISGGLIKKDLSSNEKALAFAREVAEQTGVTGQQIVLSNELLPTTEDTKAMQFDQEIDGYSVLGSFMKVFTRQSDGAVYYIANETMPLNQVDTQINYSLNQAQETVLNKFKSKQGVKIESATEKPVLYPMGSHHAELVWQMQVGIQGPLLDRRDILVSAKTGQIVRDITMIKQ